MDVSIGGLVAALVAVAAGTAVQATIGFGVNLVAVPVVALVAPEALPATLVLLAVPLAVAMVVREHHHVDRSGLAWALTGRLPGTVAGVWIVTAVSDDTLSTIVGVTVVVAVVMSVASPPIPVRPDTALVAGVVSGLMGTATSIGGPPLALLYQHHEGPVLRSTLAGSFTAGTVISLTALAIGGEVSSDDLRFALMLLPGLAAGAVIAPTLARRVDARYLRPAVLGFAAVTGTLAIVRGIL